MFNRRFMDLVRTQLIRVLAEQARAFKATPERPPAEIQELRYGPNDVAAFVDLQNLHYFLKENCRVAATQVHIPNMLNAYAAEHGMALKELQIFTGIHDQQRDPHRHDAMAKRLRWLERCGAKVTVLPLSYYTDRITKEVRAQEKGVDVRIASEILRAVNDGLRRAIVVTQDKDIAQSVIVAGEMAAERGRTFTHSRRSLLIRHGLPTANAAYGLQGTVRLPLSVNLVNRFVRAERPRLDSPEGPVANGQEQGISPRLFRPQIEGHAPALLSFLSPKFAMATSTQLRLLASNPSAMLRYRLTGRLPEGLKPESPLITLLSSIPSRDLLAIRGVVVDERLGDKGSRTFNTAGEALRWVKPSQVVFASFPAESWRLKSFRPSLSMKSLCECSSQFPDHLLRHSGAPPASRQPSSPKP